MTGPLMAQIAYDPNSIAAWFRDSYTHFDSFILAPFDILLDAANVQSLPAHFRTPAYLTPPRAQQMNVDGFNSLKVSGSGQFSKGQLIEMVAHLQKSHKLDKKDIIIIDLREEPHGFINGDAVTWYYGPLSHQQFKSADDVLHSEIQRLNLLKTQEYVIVHTQLKEADGMVGSKVPKIIKYIHAQNEQQLATELGIGYIRIPVTDHFMPEPKDVDQFLAFLENEGKNKWLHFKCRGGRGRTTTFMTMVDMIRNAKISKNDFFERQTMIAGSDLTKIGTGKQSWKRMMTESRLRFLGQFYDYLHDPKGFGKVTWSQWVSKFPPDATITPIQIKVD